MPSFGQPSAGLGGRQAATVNASVGVRGASGGGPNSWTPSARAQSLPEPAEERRAALVERSKAAWSRSRRDGPTPPAVASASEAR